MITEKGWSCLSRENVVITRWQSPRL